MVSDASMERDMFTTVSVLLSSARSPTKPPQAKLDALDDLSKILLSGKSDSELSVAAITAAWSEPVEDVSHRFLTENLEKLLLPALGQVMMDRDVAVSGRAALVLARVGAALGSDAGPFFSWVVVGVEAQAAQDPVRLSIHLSVLSQTLQLGQRDCLEPFVGQLVARLTALLERVQHHHLVQPVVLVLQRIAGDYPHVLSPSFPDVVDLLVGWSLDPAVPAAARERIAGQLGQFGGLWAAHASFAESLLNKFLADLEALHRLPHALPEMVRLAACCVGVLDGMGAALASAQAESVCARLLACFAPPLPAGDHLRQVAACLLRLSVSLLRFESPHAALPAGWLLDSLARSATSDPRSAAQLLEGAAGVLSGELAAGLDLPALARVLLGPSSSIPPLRLHADRGVATAVRSLYVRLLGESASAGTAELLVEELEAVCARRAERRAAQRAPPREGEERLASAVEEEAKARGEEVQAVFLVGVLQEWVERGTRRQWMGDAVARMLRSALPGMPGGGADGGAGAQVLALSALAAAASYAGQVEEPERRVGGLMVEAAGRCVGWEVGQGVKRGAVEALAAAAGNVNCLLERADTQRLAHAVEALAGDADPEVRGRAVECAAVAARRVGGQAGSALSVVRTCLGRVGDADPQVAADGVWALGQAAHLALLHPPRLAAPHHSPLLGVSEWQRELGAEGGGAWGGLRALDLPRLLAVTSQRGSTDLHAQLPRTLLLADSVYPHPERGGGQECAWRWDAERCEVRALVEAARLCVRSRLRTQHGGAMQTFEALELMLLEASARADVALLPRTEGAGAAAPQGFGEGGLRLLLALVGQLERQVFNAFEGCAKLPPCSPSAAKFFRANRKVCEDWFSRLRKSLTRAAALASAPYNVLEHGFRRLPELCKQAAKASVGANREEAKKLGREVDALVLTICMALRELREADAVEGFGAWARANAKQLPGVRDCAGWIQALSLQCKGHLEEAEALYRQVLPSAASPDVQGFIIKNAVRRPATASGGCGEADEGGQVLCCTELADWHGWEYWREQVRALEAGGPLVGGLAEAKQEAEKEVLRALAAFDAGDSKGARALLELGGVGEGAGLGVREAVAASKGLLLKGMLELERGNAGAAAEALGRAGRLVVEPLVLARLEIGQQLPAAQQALGLLCAVARLQERAAEGEGGGAGPGEEALVTEALPKSEAGVHDLGLWQQLLRVLTVTWGARTGEEVEGGLSVLRLRMAGIARKQNNLRYAEALLAKEGGSLLQQYQMGMLQLARGEQGAGLEGLWALWERVEDFMAGAMNDDFVLVGAEADGVREMAGKTLRKLAAQAQESSGGGQAVQGVLAKMAKRAQGDNWDAWAGELSMGREEAETAEGMGGYLLHKWTAINGEHAKGWAEYAGWCYRQGRQHTESMTRAGGGGGGSSGRRAKEEALHRRIAAALSLEEEAGVAAGTNEAVLRIAQAMAVSGEEGRVDPASGGQEEEGLREAVEQQCPWAVEQQVDAVVAVWRGGRRQALELYRSAVKAYLEYLRLRQGGAGEGAVGGRGEAYEITATLRLLRLLVKYGPELHPLFAEGLPQSPTRPWRCIVPQLFARLGHAEPKVRELVRALIQRIGTEQTHAVVYPTVVGNMEAESGGGGAQRQALRELLAGLRERRPELVSAVERFVSEVARCTLLREDELASALQEITHSISPGLRMMRDEVVRVRDNPTLAEADRRRILREKYHAITKPASLALEPVKKLFAATADCDHDRAFVATYHRPFLDALRAFREPDVYHADSAWEPMKVLLRSLNRQLRRTSLSLRSLSPFLAGLRSTDIPMPGVAVEEEAPEQLVTVHAFQGHVELLLTKTKPKKLTIEGCDGAEYTYLLKGREDLHLDERMMQLLTIVNTLLRHDKASNARSLAARHYAVTPLGPRSGLIQWCEGTIPLFGVYKAWQARQQAGEGGKEAAGLRPADMFYDKIMPALKEYGITKVTSRKEWPHEVLKRVYSQLAQETPRDLLARELWCSCLSSAELWAKTATHARSLAVMSMVGYVTGLGDRHLDNILMDFGSGEVVHIDWNVCFEKGLKLKVPELVPYRMTQTLQAAMGFSGVEGPFRLSCEKALRVLRRNKEALLTLLEAFVYDPLVDWTADKVNDQASKHVELHVSLSLFASRVDEMKVVLAENLERGQSSLGTLQQALASWLRAQTAESACKQEAEEMGGMLRVVQDKLKQLEWEEKEASERLQQLNALQPRVQEQWKYAKAALQEAAERCAASVAQQEAALSVVRGGGLAALEEQLAALQLQPVPSSPLSSWAAAMGLFASRAPGGLSDQSALVLEEQFAAGYQRAVAAAVELAGALGEYREVAKELPADYAQRGRAYEWWEALQRVMAEDGNPQTLGMLRSRMSGEQLAAKSQEATALWLQQEEQAQALRRSLQEMRAWLNAAHLHDLEAAVAEARRRALHHERFPELGRAAGCVELCACLKVLLEMKVEGTHDSEPAFAQWGEGAQGQEGPVDVEYMEWMWAQEGVWEAMETVGRVASTSLLVAKEVLHRGIDALQGLGRSLEQLRAMSADLGRVVLPEAVRALHSDAEVVQGVRAFLGLATRARLCAQELAAQAELEGEGELGDDAELGGRVGQLVAALRGLVQEYEQAVALEGPPSSGGQSGCRVLLAAFDRVFAALDKDPAPGHQRSVRWLLNRFVGKVTTMEVLLVGILRCGSVGQARSKLPALRARVQRFFNDVLRREILPRLSDTLTDIALPLMPPDTLPPLSARPLERVAVHGAVVLLLQRAQADAALGGLHAEVRRYCEAKAELRGREERVKEVGTRVQRTEQQVQALLQKQWQMGWTQGELLAVSVPAEAEAASPGERLLAHRLALLNRLAPAALHAAAAAAALTDLEARMAAAEQELTRIGQGMPSASGFSVEAVSMRIHQRRSAMLQPLERIREGLRVLEQGRGSGEVGRQMEEAHLEVLGRVEEGRRGLLGHHHESQRLDARLKELREDRQRLRGRAGQLQMGGAEKRRGVVEGQEGCRREVEVMRGCVGRVRELLQAEGQLVAETSALLDSVAKVTEGSEAVHDIHHVAVALKKEQQALKQAANDLALRIGAVPVLAAAQAGQRHGEAAGAGPGLEAVGARRMERLASEVLATMALCHAHLGTLAQLASAHAHAIHDDPAEDGDAPLLLPTAAEPEGGPPSEEGAEGRREQRNAYAVSVLKRVQQKMDGRERDGPKLGVADQVAQTIKDATSPEKLCEMYEGWTPWV